MRFVSFDVWFIFFASVSGQILNIVFDNGPLDGFGFSALPNPMEDFEADESVWDVATDENRMKPMMHLNDLSQNQDGVFVTIDAIQAGVGGDNSWSKRTHNEFTPREDKYAFEVILFVSKSQNQDVEAIARSLRASKAQNTDRRE